jgi:hypothetical protein
VVGVFDGTNGYLYQDGVLIAGPTAATGYVPNPNVDLTIGARSDGSFIFNGDIDEVAIYTNALPASAVLADYQNGTNANRPQSYDSLVLSKKPEFYYRLDETINTVTSSAVATNYGSIGAAVNGTYLPGTIPAVAGPNGQGFGPTSYACKFLPATGGYVDCTTDSGLDITTPMAVVAWFQGAPADNRFQSFLGRSDTSWRADLDPSYAHFADGGNPDAVGQTFVNDGLWHFFAGVYDGTNTLVYIDGALDGTNAASGVSGDPSADMVIGGVGDYIPSRLFKGSVAQVAVFTNSLTPTQVQTLYNAGEVVPLITQEPQPVAIGLGATASLTVKAAGSATLLYQWYQGSSKISDAAGNISGSSTASLTIANAKVSNAGSYTVVIANNFGSVTSTVAAVTITPSPDVVIPPASNTVVYAGNEINLSAGAIGAAPLYYQWYHGASGIAGATATNLTFKVAAGTNLYWVVVTNSYGSTTSSVATVVGQTFVPPPSGLVVNFAVAPGGTAADVYYGQGAYSDPGNNYWNAVPGTSGTSTGLAYNSASNLTLVAASFIFGFNNGADTDTTNGTPSWLLSYEDAVNASSPGIGTAAAPEGQLTVSDLPQGSYTVYLYGANYDGDRGSTFTLASDNGGGAFGGTNSTLNGLVLGESAIVNGVCSFAFGDNYVDFTNVVTDPFGTITVMYVPNPNPLSGFSGEAPFNGVQIIGTVVPTLAIEHSGANVIINWGPAGAALQSAPSVTGPYTTIAGATAPYTNTTSTTMQFYRVKK